MPIPLKPRRLAVLFLLTALMTCPALARSSNFDAFSDAAAQPAPAPTPTPTPRPGDLVITHVSQAGYLLGQLGPGELVYGDRTYTFSAPVPAEYAGQFYIRTLNADKDLGGDYFLSFSVNQAVWVIVALDSRIAPPPSWLAGWRSLGQALETTDANPGRTLYAKDFPAGLIILGGNRDAAMPTGRSMYSVMILKQKAGVADWADYR